MADENPIGNQAKKQSPAKQTATPPKPKEAAPAGSTPKQPQSGAAPKGGASSAAPKAHPNKQAKPAADPANDLEGWDSSAKTAILANFFLDAGIDPLRVDRCGITGVTPDAIARARAAGRKIKLICRAWREEGQVRAEVQPREIAGDHYFAMINGRAAALRVGVGGGVDQVGQIDRKRLLVEVIEVVPQDRHAHLVCSTCGRVWEIDSEALSRAAKEAASRIGFQVATARVEVIGLCDGCRKSRRSQD